MKILKEKMFDIFTFFIYSPLPFTFNNFLFQNYRELIRIILYQKMFNFILQ